MSLSLAIEVASGLNAEVIERFSILIELYFLDTHQQARVESLIHRIKHKGDVLVQKRALFVVKFVKYLQF